MSKVILNEKYIPLFKSPSRFFVVTGGRGSSKSFSVAYWCALILLFEKGHTILFTRYTMKSAHISIIPEITSKIELMGHLDKFEITKDAIISKTTGSKILFRGIRTSSGDQSANLKSLSGVTTWILDEAEELVDEETFDKINLSIRQIGKQNRVIMLLNPSTKAHWIYRRFFETKGVEPGSNITKDDTTYIHTTYLDNKDNLDKSFLKELDNTKKNNVEKYNHIIMGGWLNKAEGVIFTNWELGEFTDQLDFGFGMDFGFSSDASTLTKVAVDTKNKIIYLEELLYKTGMTTTEIYNSICDLVGKCKIIADNSEPRLIEELKRKGLNIEPCVKGAGSIVEGITLMQDYKLIITSQSINIIKELNNYVWNDRRSGTPIDMYNHSLDGIRYYVTHILKNIKAPFRLKVR
jgi:phage terminase large subunit